MFEIAIIILSRLLVVATGFYLYRKLNDRQGYEPTVRSRNGKIMRIAPRTQQGYISLMASRSKQAGKGKPGFYRGGFKAPWGW